MATKKKSKPRASKETREADAFIQTTDKMITFLHSQRKVLIGVFALFVVISATYGVSKWNHNKNEMKAQRAFFAVEKAYLKAREDAEKKKGEGEKVPSQEGSVSEYGRYLDGFKNVISEHRGSSAATLAAITLSEIYLDYKMFQEAEESLVPIIKELESSSFLSGLVYYQLGSIAEALGKCGDAQGHWQKVIDNSSVEFLSANSLLNQAVCYETSEDFAKAKELYQKVIDQYGDTAAGRNARAYLRLLNLNQKAS